MLRIVLVTRPTFATLLLGLCAATIAHAQVTPTAPPPSAEAVDTVVLELMKRRHVPGVSLAVVRDGEVVLAKGYGLADVELDAPATPDTVYQLASVTKTFTAAAVMLLVRDGKLALDDKIGDRLADLPEAWRPVTVRQLLSHTSGIKSYTSVEGFHKTTRKDYAPREILDLVAKAPLEFPPGEKWNYSNTGYFLLGMLIEKASGQTYSAFMADRVFKPLGMGRTRTNDLKAVIPGRALGYAFNGRELENGEYTSPTQPFAAGMLVSTVVDLAKWDAALAEGTLLDAATLQQMWAPTKLAGGEEAGYGFGWQVSKTGERRSVSHGGGIPGFSTELLRYPDDRLTVIVLTNLEGGHSESIAKGVAGLYVPELAKKPAVAIADADPETTARLRGFFEQAAKGEVDPALFTEEAGKVLIPKIKGSQDKLASLGALKTFELLERKDSDDGRSLEYRAVFENETLRAPFSLDKDGKIRGVMIRPEE